MDKSIKKSWPLKWQLKSSHNFLTMHFYLFLFVFFCANDWIRLAVNGRWLTNYDQGVDRLTKQSWLLTIWRPKSSCYFFNIHFFSFLHWQLNLGRWIVIGVWTCWLKNLGHWDGDQNKVVIFFKSFSFCIGDQI